MNKLNIASTGYPGTTESWKFLNTMIQELAEAVAGQVTDTSTPVIIYGITAHQTGYSPGFFVWKEELYRFEGGQSQDYVCIIEDIDSATYNTDMTNSSQLADLPTYYKRYARFGGANEGVDRFLFADMKRMKGLFDISEKVNPATEDDAGIVEIATQAEVDAGVDDSKVVTPLKFNSIVRNRLSGTVLIGQFTNNVQVINKAVIFPDDINNTYQVLATVVASDDVNSIGGISVSIYDKSASGFFIQVRRFGTNSFQDMDINVDWSVIY